jgi:hypothetical protein
MGSGTVSSRVGTGIARITHLFTCGVALYFSIVTVGSLPRQLIAHGPFQRGPEPAELAITALALLVFGATSLRAFWRVLRRRPILSDARIGEHPVLSALVMLGSQVAHFLVVSVFYAIRSVYPEFDGNAAGPLMLAAMLYAIALLVGEFVLTGRETTPIAH